MWNDEPGAGPRKVGLTQDEDLEPQSNAPSSILRLRLVENALGEALRGPGTLFVIPVPSSYEVRPILSISVIISSCLQCHPPRLTTSFKDAQDAALKVFGRLMKYPDRARTILRGKLRDEDDGSWVWSAILEDSWNDLVPTLYSEVGVFELPPDSEPAPVLPSGIRLDSLRVRRVYSLTRG